MISKNIEESWEFYIKYSKEHYPEEYKDMNFDIEKKEWFKKEIEIEVEDNVKKTKVIKKTKEVKTKKKRKRIITSRSLKIKEFQEIRDVILERDGFKCVECGSEYMIQVHHTIALSEGGDNNPNNLTTLCYNCHMQKHEGDPVYDLMKCKLEHLQNPQVDN